MSYADANVFLRYLVGPATPHDRLNAETASIFFQRVREGLETFTTSEAVIAEVVFILSSKRHYALPRDEVTERLKPLLELAGCALPRKELCLDALELWTERPELSFVDALGAMYSQQLEIPIVSFDAALNRVPGVKVWQFPDEPTS